MEIGAILDWFKEKIIDAIGDPTATNVIVKIIDAIKGFLGLGILPETPAEPEV